MTRCVVLVSEVGMFEDEIVSILLFLRIDLGSYTEVLLGKWAIRISNSRARDVYLLGNFLREAG